MASCLKEIAEELDLSVSTVSRAINNSGRISADTRRAVLEAARRRNYTPNRIAQTLRQKHSNTVGLIVPDIGDYFADVIKGIESELSTHGYSLLLADSHENPIKEANYINLMQQSQVDGLIIATVSDEFQWIDNYQASGTPVIFFDNEPKDLECNKVVLNNIKATEIAVDHLVKLGHRDIALICGNVKESTASFRRKGFTEAMAKHGLEVNYNLIKEGLYFLDAGYSSMEELILSREENPFSAVIVSTNRLACSAIHAIKDYGLRYPEDLSFIGFDIEDPDRLISPTITTVLQPKKRLGQLIAHRLFQEMQNAADGNDKENENGYSISFVDPLIKFGESTAPLRNGTPSHTERSVNTHTKKLYHTEL